MTNRLIDVPIEPWDAEHRSGLIAALPRLADHDGVSLVIDEASGQMALAGPGEQALDDAVTTLRTTCGVGLRLGPPQICYRETVLRRGLADETVEPTGSGGQFARVALSVEPASGGDSFVSKISADALPAEFALAIKRSAAETLKAGLCAGFPLVDVRVVLRDAAFHATQSTVAAFETATAAALRQAILRADAVLLEPLMAVTVATPDACADALMQDLRSRRGQSLRAASSDGGQTLEAVVPLAGLFGYAETLRELSGGRASFEMRFERYAPVPDDMDDPYPPAAAARA